MTSTNHASGDGHHYSDAEMHNDDVAHEHSDINIRRVLAFGAGMVVLVIVSAVLMRIMFLALESQAAANDPQMSPLARPGGQQPPAPVLLRNEPASLSKFRAEEMKKLEGYGWVDERAGVAHVPIEEAKTLILQRGLPVRASGAVDDPRLGTHAPANGEASGGRAIAVPKAAAAPAQPAAAETKTGEIKK
jgi:hypothetical protein